ncbi:MAG: Adenine phosphoribosyltransferase [Deltaproteobacteria bacterium]|jgi:adenine phosphoribosyltransferase|nr:Adenine phosphoribosyltransferase [Deltaproteobacteria bacterium]
MAEILDFLETGESCQLEIPGLAYPLTIPWVWLPGEEQDTRIASLNLVGKIEWNQDLGKLIARRIQETLPDLEGICFITAVEKALQLAQVIASELGVRDMAIAYNRVKPHMETSRRPVIQVGTDSVTSGIKFLAFYERDINLLVTHATRGVIILDDVVTTGGTISGLVDLLDQVARLKGLQHPIPIHGIFCVAEEGKRSRILPAPVYSLARLPDPVPRKPGTLKGRSLQESLWPKR